MDGSRIASFLLVYFLLIKYGVKSDCELKGWLPSNDDINNCKQEEVDQKKYWSLICEHTVCENEAAFLKVANAVDEYLFGDCDDDSCGNDEVKWKKMLNLYCHFQGKITEAQFESNEEAFRSSLINIRNEMYNKIKDGIETLDECGSTSSNGDIRFV